MSVMSDAGDSEGGGGAMGGMGSLGMSMGRFSAELGGFKSADQGSLLKSFVDTLSDEQLRILEK